MRIPILLVSVVILSVIYSCSFNKKEKENTKSDSLAPFLSIINAKIAENPKVDSLYKLRAAYYLGIGKPDSALSDIRRAINLNNQVSEYHILMGDIYLAMSNVNASRSALMQAFELDPKNVEPSLKLAELHLFTKEYDKVYIYLDKAVEIEPGNARAYFMRGFAQLEQGDSVKGIQNIQKATEMNPEYYDAFVKLGYVMSAKHNPMAEQYFKAAIKLQPRSVEARYGLGMYYQESNQPQDALKEYDMLLTISPAYRDAFYNIGYINLVWKIDFDKAIENFSKAIAIDPAYAEAYYNRGLSYEMQHKFDLARKDYKQALRLKENFEKAIQALNRIGNK